MISELFAFRQVERMAGLQFFPSKHPAVLELVKALRHVAKDDADAEQMITTWLRDNREAPTPCDFYDIGRNRPVASPSARERYTGDYDPAAEYAAWAKANIRRVK